MLCYVYIYSYREPFMGSPHLKHCQTYVRRFLGLYYVIIMPTQGPQWPRRYLLVRSGLYPMDLPHENQIPLVRSVYLNFQ